MKRIASTLLLAAPLTVGAYPFIDGVNKMAHIPFHGDNVLYGLTLNPVDVSLHRPDVPVGVDRDIQSALARAYRRELPAQAVPTLPDKGCVSASRPGGPKSCWVYDEKGNLYYAADGWRIWFEICRSEPREGFGARADVIAELECNRLVPASPGQQDCFEDVLDGALPRDTECR